MPGGGGTCCRRAGDEGIDRFLLLHLETAQHSAFAFSTLCSNKRTECLICCFPELLA